MDPIPINKLPGTSLPFRYGFGFTIVEMILAILVSAILAVGVVGFIGRAVDGIDSSTNRNQLASAGRTAIDRLAMELHNALPNSIRASAAQPNGDQCIEFIPVFAATTYINPSFSGAGIAAFDIVDIFENGAVIHPTPPPPKYAVIYPNRLNQIYDGENGLPATWPNFANNRPIQKITSIVDKVATPGVSTVNLFVAHRFTRRSPSQRFFVVEDPVSYCVVSDKLYRYTNYGFFITQPTQEVSGSCVLASGNRCLPNYTSAPDKMLITDSIDNTGLTAFTVGVQTLTRNALVAMELNFTRDGDVVILNHEILTRSVP